MTTLSAAAVEVEIKGALYAVEPIAPGECGTSAVRVVKLVNGESYDVIRTHLNIVECSCPDFVCRHEGKGTVCKHGAAMVARGFLPVASPVPSKPAVAPITRKDRARARAFGIKLPAGAEVEAPEVAPAKVGGPIDLSNLVIIINPPAEVVSLFSTTDRPLDFSTLTILIGPPAEVVSVMTTAPRPADRRKVAGRLAVAGARPLDPDDAEDPDGESWDTWTDEDRWTIIEVVEPAPAPAPGAGPAQGNRFREHLAMSMPLEVATGDEVPREPTDTTDHGLPSGPSPEAEADHLGYRLVMDGEDPNPPRGMSFARLVSFFDGVQAARFDIAMGEIAERDDLESWFDSLPEPTPDRDFSEAVEAIGYASASKGGAL
jgi:hypothetical protein